MDRKTLVVFALGAVVATALFASLFVFQIVVPAQPAQIPKQIQAPALYKFKASGWSSTLEYAFLIIDAGKNRGIWQNHGIDPEFVTIPGRNVAIRDLKEQVQSGVKIGFTLPTTVMLARSEGVPVKFVAGFIGELANKVFVMADSPIKTVKDLDGKRIGVTDATSGIYRIGSYIAKKNSINPEFVHLGNLTNRVVALKLGRIDAFITAEGAALRLVDSGELRVLFQFSDVLPKPQVGLGIFATDDLIEQSPDLVRRFVTATLEVVSYLNENPRYASELYSAKTTAPRDLAQRAISQIPWTPSGRGSGRDLVSAVANDWQVNKDSGVVPADINVKVEDAVDIRFLP